VWPDWYGADVGAGKMAKYSKDVSSLWLEKAEALVSVGKLPLPAGYPNAIQVAQITMALGSPNLIIAMAVTEANLGLKELKSVVATATWLASQSEAKVALLAPHNLVVSEEFDRVIKESLGHLIVAPEIEPSIEEVPVVTVTSINGRPNPTSPGEVLLAQKLAKDPELAGHFSFNQLVKSVHGKEYKVDLLWPGGKLVVEVDGYSFHSSAFAFGQDRHRDYELLISGYRVLRLTHEEIFKDTPRTIAKIRDSVRFLNKNPAHGA
jgi:very-short-patch-repair endonuclease